MITASWGHELSYLLSWEGHCESHIQVEEIVFYVDMIMLLLGGSGAGERKTISSMGMKILCGSPVFSLLCLFWTGLSSQELEHRSRSLIIQEGEGFTINYNSSKTSHALYWYRQKHSEGLIFLMVLWKFGEEKSQWNITAKSDEKKQQSSLHITASQPSHSGIYFCREDT